MTSPLVNRKVGGLAANRWRESRRLVFASSTLKGEPRPQAGNTAPGASRRSPLQRGSRKFVVGLFPAWRRAWRLRAASRWGGLAAASLAATRPPTTAQRPRRGGNDHGNDPVAGHATVKMSAECGSADIRDRQRRLCRHETSRCSRPTRLAATRVRQRAAAGPPVSGCRPGPHPHAGRPVQRKRAGVLVLGKPRLTKAGAVTPATPSPADAPRPH